MGTPRSHYGTFFAAQRDASINCTHNHFARRAIFSVFFFQMANFIHEQRKSLS